ncbi:Helicase MOV-10 [Rhodotorula kratochvilovae]
MALAQCRSSSTTESSVPSANSQFCVTCKEWVPTPTWMSHIHSHRHAEAAAYQQYQDRLASSPAPSSVSSVEVLSARTVDFGHVEFDPNSGKDTPGMVVKPVSLQAGSTGCTIVKAIFVSSTRSNLNKNRFTTQDFDKKPLVVAPHEKATFNVNFHPRNTVGVFTDSLLIYFSVPSGDGTPPSSPMFQRLVRGKVSSTKHIEQFSAKEPYAPSLDRRKFRPRAEQRDVVPAPRIDNGGVVAVQWVVKLPLLIVPYKLRQVLTTGSLGSQINEVKHKWIPVFELASYGEFWKRLLQIEHVQEDLDVPGLAEKRPSVLFGDRVRLQAEGATKYWFEGRVVDVCQKRVGLVFDKQFRPFPSDQFTVQFHVSDSAARRQLFALKEEPARPELIFPSAGTSYPGPPTQAQIRSHKFLDSKIAKNPHQRDAVLSIFYGSSGPAPFVLFGPPGTGKTTTLVEVLLLAAPSNAAADVLCGSLNLPSEQVLRLNATSRMKVEVPKDVERYCYTAEDDDDRYVCPELEVLREYRVVVVTCMSASMLPGVGIKKGHFTHVFVDEAPYVPMSLADDTTSVILAGDPKQLGPVVHSSVAVRFGLNKSLLERLMELPDYAETNHERRGTTYVKLTNNYRSHPSVLTIPNELFYGGELCAMADVATQNKLLGWSGWAMPDFPIIFHSVKGEDEREGNNPSFFNVAEITVVDSYVMHLLSPLNGGGVEEKDIGVIAPYAAQVRKLQRALNRDKMTVGSVEQFQGQERSVIIISTTRSNRQFLEHDTLFALGFLSSPKRFNVAVTRAASGLIVVGNADTLAVDPLWRKFLLFVHDHGGWVGEAWDADAARKEEFDPVKAALSELEELQRRMGGLDLEGEE